MAQTTPRKLLEKEMEGKLETGSEGPEKPNIPMNNIPYQQLLYICNHNHNHNHNIYFNT